MGETWSDTFVSRYLSKRDLADGPVVGTIDYVDHEEAEGATKETLHLLYFTGGDIKPLILKPTNRKMLKQLFGDSKRARYGQQVEVYVKDDVEFQGETIGGIRLRLPSGSGKGRGPAAQVMTWEQAQSAAIAAGMTVGQLKDGLKAAGATAYNAVKHTPLVRALVMDFERGAQATAEADGLDDIPF